MNINGLPAAMRDADFPTSGSAFDTPNGKLLAWGTTVPSAASGYAPGCLFIDTDASAGQQVWVNEGTKSSCSFKRHEAGNIELLDSETLVFGTGDDVTFTWDGSNLTVTGSSGNIDIDGVGLKLNDGDSFTLGDGNDITVTYVAARDATVIKPVGGFLTEEGLPDRFGLKWVAGQRGKPGINADIQNAAEATRMVTDPDFEILGTNASSDDVTFNAEGGITFTTDGADGDSLILLPHLDANQTAWTQVTWGSDQETRWEAHIVTGAAITNSVVWAGLKLTNTDVVATDDDQAFFRYQNGVNSGKWQAVSSIGGTDDAADAGVTVATSTAYHLVIDINSSRIAKFYINGALVKTTAALTDAKDFIPYIGVMASGAAEAKTLTIRGQAISRNFA